MKITKYIVAIILINFIFISSLVIGIESLDKILDNTGPLGTSISIKLIKIRNFTSGSNNQTDQCIITIDGDMYDITSLQSSHEGGDVFECGSDMTKIFYSAHNHSLLNGQLSNYKISESRNN
jgi:hypothetical protein